MTALNATTIGRRIIAMWAIALSLLVVSATTQAAEDAAPSSDKQAKGMQLIGNLLAGTEAGGIPLPDRFTRYTVEHLFGDVWQGDDLSLQDRSFITCVRLLHESRRNALALVGARRRATEK